MRTLLAGRLVPFLAALLFVAAAQAQHPPLLTCDAGGIGSVPLTADGPPVSILEVSTGTTGGVPYCLVKVLVPQAINIWVGLPTAGQWNGRLQSQGGGGYAGSVGVPSGAIQGGYVGIATDTGHVGGSGTRSNMPRQNHRPSWRSQNSGWLTRSCERQANASGVQSASFS